MKRNNRQKNNNKKTKKNQIPVPDKQKDISRRTLLRKTRNAAAGIFAVVGGGYALIRYVKSENHEHDLTRLGNGKPTIVQIHDPQCSQCRLLQKNARYALDQIDSANLDYVVANIRTSEGRQFASRYGVQHITLMLFDDKGKLKQVLNGQRSRQELRSAFQQLL